MYSKKAKVETHFLFGPRGELLAEVSPKGNVEKAYVWLDGEPYSMVSKSGSIFYFHNDRMGTPRRLTDAVGKIVWRAEFRPFGEFETVDTDPDKDGVAVENKLRFAGQYDEGPFNGFYYNWHRNYEPMTGRYLQPEPLLQDPDSAGSYAHEGAALSVYLYALNNPIMYLDEDGLYPFLSDSWNDCYQMCLDKFGAKDWIYLIRACRAKVSEPFDGRAP